MNLELWVKVDLQCSWRIDSVSPQTRYTPLFPPIPPYSKFSIPGSSYIFGFPVKIKSHTNSKLQTILA